MLPTRGLGGAIDAFQLRHTVLWPRHSPRYGLASQPVHELWRTIALAPVEESHKMHDHAAAVHRSAPVLRGSYRWCAASSSPSALAPTTGMAGAGLGCPRLQPIGFAIGGYEKARSVWDLVIARVLTERSGPKFALAEPLETPTTLVA